MSVFALWKTSVIFKCDKNSDVSSANDNTLLGVDFAMPFTKRIYSSGPKI